MGARSPSWIPELRSLLRREQGEGWSLSEQSGKVKLTRRFENGSRSSVTLAVPWNPACSSTVLTTVQQIRERMDQQRLGLKAAYALVAEAPATNGGPADWAALVERYKEQRIGSGQIKPSTWDRDVRYRMERTLDCLNAHPAPRDGHALLLLYLDRWCGPPGTIGRKRQLLEVAAFLRFAVERCGTAKRWLPPTDLEELVGLRDTTANDTVPIKPVQLEQLLSGITDPSLRLAVALVGLFGLRPAELLVIRVENGRLLIPQIKRNRRTSKNPKPPRMVLPLETPALAGEGTRVLDQYAHAKVPLPRAIANARDLKSCGSAFRQYLDRNPIWAGLKLETPLLTPYSLRHGYALRAHVDLGLSIRVTAALMGHDPITHQRHYGRWTDQATVEAEVARAVATRSAENRGRAMDASGSGPEDAQQSHAMVSNLFISI